MCFEELAKKLSSKLKAIVYKLNRPFIFFDGEDLYQEALARLWLDYKNGKLNDKTDSYILQGCYFHLKNYIRKNYDKAKLTSFESSVDSEGRALDLSMSPDLEDPISGFELINCNMLIERINNNGLTKREKEVFNLSLGGLTVREIARRLGVSHVRVVKLKAKIKVKCRKYVDF